MEVDYANTSDNLGGRQGNTHEVEEGEGLT